MAGQISLADTSVYVLQGRHASVRRRFESLLAEGRLAACHMTSLEYLNNAPHPKGYEILWQALRGGRWMDVSTAAMDRAMAVHRLLAAESQHRATVLHYDADYDRIAAVTGQPTEWVAPKGSL